MMGEQRRFLNFVSRARGKGCVVFLAVCFLPLFGMTGCEPVEAPGAGEGPGRRDQVLALRPQQELQLGRQAYAEILDDPRQFGHVLPTDSPECERVRAVARRIIRAAGIKSLDQEINLRGGYRYEWEVNVFDNPRINAFCLPGGKIAVFEGLLRVVENDDQLATVISHEVAHALAHHVSERFARAQSTGGILQALINKAYDRRQEAEADHIGIFLMTFANYDPREAVRLWERMERIASGGHGLPEILSDHPSDARRIQSIATWVPQAEAAKRAYEQGRIEPGPDG
jgi:predicted Zn-dependent protease